MTKLLIAIPTCETYKGNPSSPNRDEAARRTACLETWLRDCPIDYKFFNDELGYDRLSDKMILMAQYAQSNGYTHLLRVDTDAYVYVDRLLKSGFEAHQYTGYCIDYPKWNDAKRYACGAGFVLDERAITVVANNPSPDTQADDMWVGRILYRNGIRCHRDTRYLTGGVNHFVDLKALPQIHPYIVLHAVSPEGMRELHRRGDPGADCVAPDVPLNEPDYRAQWGAYAKH